MENNGNKFDAKKYVNDYKKEHYHQLRVWIPKNAKNVLESLSADTGKPISQLVIDAIEKTYNVTIK